MALLDADIARNAEANSVDIAASVKAGDINIGIAPEGPDIITEPEYGLTVGAFEEIAPLQPRFWATPLPGRDVT